MARCATLPRRPRSDAMTRKPAAIRAHESKPAEPEAFQRHDGRTPRTMRGFKVQRGVARNAEGSALVSMGRTRVLCTASVEDRVPGWLRGQRKGWVTAEYRSEERRVGKEWRSRWWAGG